MTAFVDLHMHTHYSDGDHSPAEVVEAAARLGLRAIAITDHDTIRGNREAIPLAREAQIELVPAIEMTTRWPNKDLLFSYSDVDVLAYFVNFDDPTWVAFTEALMTDHLDRMSEACRRCTADGFPMTMDDVWSQNPRYGGPGQMERAIFAKGYARDHGEASRMMAWYFESSRLAMMTTRAAIEQVHLAGGVAVLAHPVVVCPQGQRLVAADLRELVDAGLDGLEIYHPRLDDEAREYFLRLAREFNLLVTGGTDMHGGHRGLEIIGGQPVTEEMLEAVRGRRTRGC
jgi:3',5'-nucleoside bisphosphate phosphatase